MTTAIERSRGRATLVAVFFAGAAAALVAVLSFMLTSGGLSEPPMGVAFHEDGDDLVVVKAPVGYTYDTLVDERTCPVAAVNGHAVEPGRPVVPGDRVTFECVSRAPR